MMLDHFRKVLEDHDDGDVLGMALGAAVNYIETLEEKVARQAARIADLEALFEPFLRHFLKMTEGDGP